MDEFSREAALMYSLLNNFLFETEIVGIREKY